MSQQTYSAFISYPKQATFGRNLPKNKIYEHSGANTRLKDLFVEQVEQIVWQYKLAPETINLPSKSGVPEIQVFTIQLKTPVLHLDVLRCIDGAVQFPIIFELSFDGQTQVVAAYKRPNESDASRWVPVRKKALPIWSPALSRWRRSSVRSRKWRASLPKKNNSTARWKSTRTCGS